MSKLTSAQSKISLHGSLSSEDKDRIGKICVTKRLDETIRSFMNNPWEEISLDDYENHMSLDSVKQLQTMNENPNPPAMLGRME